MERPIKIPTKRTQEVMFVRSKPSQQPMLWSSEVSKTKGLSGEHKPTSLKTHALRSAADEVALLEAIAETPGKGTNFYARRAGISYSKAFATLRQYQADGVVESSPGDRRSLLWRLT